MDGQRFDELTRRLGTGASRRRFVAGIAGAALSVIGIGRGRNAAGAQSPWWSDYADFSGTYCGGIAGIRCPAGYVCVDNPDDTCDPAAAGADCARICQKQVDASACAAILCETDTYCCDDGCGNGSCVAIGDVCPQATSCAETCGGTVCGDDEYCCNESCGICAPLGGSCTEQFCGEPCGGAVCGDGEYCCNESCGICAPLDGVCTQEFCGEPCGGNVCGEGEYCCNESCGICAPLGGVCTRQVCNKPCGDAFCGVGEYCCNESCGICAPYGVPCTQQGCL